MTTASIYTWLAIYLIVCGGAIVYLGHLFFVLIAGLF